MFKRPLTFVGLSGLLFGIWPIFAKLAKASPWLTSFMISLGATTTLLIIGIYQKRLLEIFQLDTKSLLSLSGSGIIDGLGIFAFGMLITWEGEEITRLLPMAVAIIPVVTFLAGVFFLGESFSAQKILGIFIVAIGIYFLNFKN